MKSTLSLLVVFCTVIVGCSQTKLLPTQKTEAFSSQSPQELIQTIEPWINQTMIQCPARIWPDYSWREFQVMYLQTGVPPQLWRASTGRFESYPASSLPDALDTNLYSFTKIDQVETIVINVDEYPEDTRSAENLFGLAVHEGFHRWGQKRWAPKKSSGRGTAYPLSSEPRIYRTMMEINLAKFSRNEGAPHLLQQAAYWFQKWQTEFPEENASSADGYEGTAQFVEKMALALSQLGCNATESQLKDFVTKDAIKTIELNDLLDIEGYSMGSLGAFVLRFGSTDQDWYQRMKQGQTPLEVVFENVQGLEQAVDTTIEKAYRERISQSNRETEELIQPDLSLLRSGDYVIVQLPAGPGSYTARGFFKLSEFKNVTLIPISTAESFADKYFELSVSAPRSLVNLIDVPCTYAGNFVIATPTDVTYDGKSLAITSVGLEGSGSIEKRVAADGRIFYCSFARPDLTQTKQNQSGTKLRLEATK